MIQERQRLYLHFFKFPLQRLRPLSSYNLYETACGQLSRESMKNVAKSSLGIISGLVRMQYSTKTLSNSINNVEDSDNIGCDYLFYKVSLYLVELYIENSEYAKAKEQINIFWKYCSAYFDKNTEGYRLTLELYNRLNN